VNLNVRDESVKRPERFDLQRHTRDSRPVLSGAKAVFGVITLALSLILSIGGGGYLMAAGEVPDFGAILRNKKTGSQEDQQAVNGEKDDVEALLKRYREFWNSPFDQDRYDQVFAGSFSFGSVPKEVGKVHLSESHTGDVAVRAARLDNYAVVSPSEAYAEASFIIGKTETVAEHWGQAVFQEISDAELIAERAVRYSFTLEDSGNGWRIKEQRLLTHTEDRIRTTADLDAVTPELPPVADIAIERREPPDIEALVARYAAAIQSGEIGSDLIYSQFTYESAYGDKQSADAARVRLKKFKSRHYGSKVSHESEGTTQVSASEIVSLVRFRVDFAGSSSAGDRFYTAAWKERLSFVVDEGGNSWRLLKAKRLSTSPILEQFEH
jgi:hypothetical protein